jgi:FixJ family two-component response regulator
LQDNVPVISIVDDDESVRMAVRSLVRSLGLVAHAFGSAEEFLQSSHLEETACLISDVQMPGMSGVELQAKLADDGRCIPIIFITAFPTENVRARVLRAGAACFLYKPFEGRALVECLDDILGKPVIR